MKTMICRKYSCGKVAQFSKGNFVLYASASKIHGLLWSETCAFSTQLNKPLAANRTYLHFENYDLQEVFLSRTNFLSQEDNVVDASASTTDVSLYRDTCVSLT
jgi:hypothetical protein